MVVFAVEASSGDRPRLKSGHPPRVLVVDDDKAIRALISTILTRKGFEVEVARNGAEAIQKIEASPYQAILLDLMMPIADGYEVINYLERTAPERLGACVIVLTAVSTADLRKLEGKPVFRIIRKPFDVDELVTTVAECVEGRSDEPLAGAAT
jgi:CheY-like chemotaxis protein